MIDLIQKYVIHMMIRVLKIHVVNRLSTNVTGSINQIIRGKEGLGLVSRLDGRGFRTWS